jgi:hypothetical protein
LRREFAGGREDERLGLSHGDVDGLQHGYREGGGFTRAGLGLCDDISPLRDREDSTLLNCGGLFKVCTMQVSENEIRARVSSAHCKRKCPEGGPLLNRGHRR